MGCSQIQVKEAKSDDQSVIEGNGVKVFFSTGLRNDAEMTSRLMQQVQRCLTGYFGQTMYQQTHSAIPFEIHLQGEASQSANEGTATTESGTTDGKLETYYARLKIMAFSKFQEKGYTIIGDPFDQNYYLKVLAHEYSQTFMDVMTRLKATGWRKNTAPAWFIQGYPEWLAIQCLPKEIATDRLSKYEQKAKELLIGNKDNPYVFGATKLARLHQKYGPEKVRNLILSPMTTFTEAFHSTFRKHENQFSESWKKWLLEMRKERQ